MGMMPVVLSNINYLPQNIKTELIHDEEKNNYSDKLAVVNVPID